MNEKATLYGVKVEFKDYERLKAIADHLWNYTKNDKDKNTVLHRKCVRIALKAVEEARKL